MAEYYFNYICAAEGITAESCGLAAYNGSIISQNAEKVLTRHNIIVGRDDPGAPHIARQINEDIIKKSDIIYGITIHHEARLKEIFPKFAGKITSMPEDIGDPYGGSLEVYEKCFEKIKKSVDIIIKNLTVGQGLCSCRGGGTEE